jgi:hypothetical protein
MALSLSQEFLLAAACAVWPSCDRRSEAIRELAAGPVDWDRFQRVVARHRVAGLVHDGLTRAQPAVPPDIAEKIGRQAAALVRRNLAYAAESVRLQTLFAAAELPVLFMKGVSLGVLAYGDLGLRHSVDIDLFVTPKSIATAEILLERAGYSRTEPPAAFSEGQVQTWLLRCKDMTYVHAEKRFKVELHARLFNNPRLMAEMPVTGSMGMVPLVNGIGLRTFSEDDLFAYLCAHGAVHCWFRLKWLADIAALLARQPEGGIERFYRAAHARGAGRCAAQAMLLCQRILGTPIPHELITSLSKDAAVRWLDAIAMKAITAERRLGTTWNSLALFLLDSDWRYRLAELNDYSTNPVDILTLPLPKKLRVLYPALRLPLWLWRYSVHRGHSTQ